MTNLAGQNDLVIKTKRVNLTAQAGAHPEQSSRRCEISFWAA